MKVITREGRAANAASEWKQTYFRKGEWQYGNDKEVIYYKLVALGCHPDYKDVDKTIGNTSWTSIYCNECNESVLKAIQLGEEPDYESSTACICKPCLLKAMDEMK